jgi:hypothetical protein
MTIFPSQEFFSAPPLLVEAKHFFHPLGAKENCDIVHFNSDESFVFNFGRIRTESVQSLWGVYPTCVFLECSYRIAAFLQLRRFGEVVFHILLICYLNSLGRCSPFLVIFHPFLILFILKEIDPQLTGDTFLFGDNLKWLRHEYFSGRER